MSNSNAKLYHEKTVDACCWAKGRGPTDDKNIDVTKIYLAQVVFQLKSISDLAHWSCFSA